MERKAFWKLGAAAVLVLALAACTGGSVADDGVEVELVGVLASDGTLAGRALDLTDAEVTRNGDPAEVSLRPGMVVAVSGTESAGRVRVRRADVRVELKGPVTAVDAGAGALSVLGFEVRVDALTRIEEEDGATLALADLAVGDFVEVSGQPLPQGAVLATYIERKSGAEAEVEARGFACGLDAGAGTFALWAGPDCDQASADTGVSVDYSGARVEGEPAEGARVEVKGELSGSVIRAREVEFGASGSGGGHAKVELYGPVAALDEAARSFELLGYLVDYSGARVEGTLSEGAYVEVEGYPDPEDPGLVRAYEVEVKYRPSPEHPPTHEVEGRVEAIDHGAMTLTVAGVALYADGGTLVKQDDPDRPLAFADLAAGDWVEVKYDAAARNDAGAYYAVKIERKGYHEETGEHRELEGYLTDLDREGRSFAVGGVRVVADDATRYEDDRSDRYLSADEFWSLVREGDRVEVEGELLGDGTLLAREIELKDGGGS